MSPLGEDQRPGVKSIEEQQNYNMAKKLTLNLITTAVLDAFRKLSSVGGAMMSSKKVINWDQ